MPSPISCGRGGKRTALVTETMRRELEESFYPSTQVEDAGEGPAEAREIMERQWASMATSTSGPIAVVRRKGRRRSAVKTGDAASSVARAVESASLQSLGRKRRRLVKSIDSVEKRRSVLLTLEMVLQKAIHSRAVSR